MEKVNVKTKVGGLLNSNKIAKISEILVVFSVAFGLYKILKPYAGDKYQNKKEE